MSSFRRLIRFVGADAQVHYGDPIVSSVTDLNSQLEAGTLQAEELIGDTFSQLSPSGQTLNVKQLLGPLTQDAKSLHVPIIRCIGLNYMKHSKSSIFFLNI